MKDTLESVLQQDFEDYEVIVVDDGSTDGSVAVVEGMKDSRIRLIRKENGGVSSTRNRAMEEAKGKYFAFLDSDDYWYPDHLKRAYEFFERYPDCGIYSGRYQNSSWEEERPVREETDAEAQVVNYFYSGFRFIQTSVFIARADYARAAGGFNEELRFGEDLLFFYKAALNSPFMGLAPVVTGLYMSRKDSAVKSTDHMEADIGPLYSAFREAAQQQSPNPPLKHVNVALRFLQLQWIGKSLLSSRKRLSRLIKEDRDLLGCFTSFGLKFLIFNLSLWRMIGRFFLRRMKALYLNRGRKWSAEFAAEREAGNRE